MGLEIKFKHENWRNDQLKKIAALTLTCALSLSALLTGCSV